MLNAAEIMIRGFSVVMAVFGGYAFVAAAGGVPRLSVRGTVPELAGVVHVWAGVVAVGFALMTSGFLYRGRPVLVWGTVAAMVLTIVGTIVRVHFIEKRQRAERLP